MHQMFQIDNYKILQKILENDNHGDDDDRDRDDHGDGSGSDYVLDSDHSDGGSDASPRNMHNLNDYKESCCDASIPESCMMRKRSSKSLKKVSSTGNLRVYHKTDLKNKIGAVEHRLLMLEKRLSNIEKQCSRNNDYDKNYDNSIPTIIKFVGGCLILLHFGRML